MYDYNATVVRVIDGDTVVADVDLGFGVWVRGQSFRLLGLNAREHTETGGREATGNLESLLPNGTAVTLSSVRNDKYGGRYDAIITKSTAEVNALLVQTGWAAAWNGVGTKPVPPWPRNVT